MRDVQTGPHPGFSFIGVASGWGAKIKSTEDAAAFFKENFPLIQRDARAHGCKALCESIVMPSFMFKDYKHDIPYLAKEQLIFAVCQDLATAIQSCVQHKRFPVVIGGDQSLSIGTWLGVTKAYQCREKMGLIWFDAHMDAHTPDSSYTHAIHGMALATLMGYGSPTLLELLQGTPVVAPEHVVLIGTRSFEDREAALLKKLGVKIHYAHDIRENGLKRALEESLNKLLKKVNHIGLSFDLDVFDPFDAPGTGCHTPNGLAAAELFITLDQLQLSHHLVGLEIVEFNPNLDQNSRTFQTIRGILNHCLFKKHASFHKL